MAEEKVCGTEKKLCSIDDIGKDPCTLDAYKKLVTEPQYVCKGCGRVAKNETNLCAPERM